MDLAVWLRSLGLEFWCPVYYKNPADQVTKGWVKCVSQDDLLREGDDLAIRHPLQLDALPLQSALDLGNCALLRQNPHPSGHCLALGMVWRWGLRQAGSSLVHLGLQSSVD